MKMNTALAWQAKGIYFEACNCDSVCPCYTAQPPTYGYCEGNCAWHITQGRYGDVSLDDLNVIMVQRCDGFMRETPWQCWFYLDDRATAEQFDALKKIFTLEDGGHLAKTFGKLWQVKRVERAQIEMKLDGWQHRTSILGKAGLAIGLFKLEAGPTLCRVPNVPGVAALAEEDWFQGGEMKFDYENKNALSSTFAYQSDQ
jgi:hypothetical protein